jgi:hypothetical protein
MSQASAACRTRRIFSAVTISSGSPNRVPDLLFTSQKTTVRPRRATTSISLPPAQAFVARIL